MATTLSYLKSIFSDYNLSKLNKPGIKDLISSKYNNEIFPPYIPFVGKYYFDTPCRVLVYATAQNLGGKYADDLYEKSNGDTYKLIERLYWDWNFQMKYRKNKKAFCFTNIAIQPFQDGILPALVGVFFYAWFQRSGFEDLNTVMHHISVSNYYKYSLRNKRDLNPNNLTNVNGIADTFYKLNNDLVTEEVKCLNPHIIITFNGRPRINHLRILFPQGFRINNVNDPSWLKRGGSGCFKKNVGSWTKRVDENIPKKASIREIVDQYCEQISHKGTSNKFWEQRIDMVSDYLLWYYLKWKDDRDRINRPDEVFLEKT